MINETFVTNSSNSTNTPTSYTPTASPSIAAGLSQAETAQMMIVMFIEGLIAYGLLTLYFKKIANKSTDHCGFAAYILAAFAGAACMGAVVNASSSQKISMKEALMLCIPALVGGMAGVLGTYHAGARLVRCCNNKCSSDRPEVLLFSTPLPQITTQVAPRDSSDAFARVSAASVASSVPSVPTVASSVSMATTNTLSMA